MDSDPFFFLKVAHVSCSAVETIQTYMLLSPSDHSKSVPSWFFYISAFLTVGTLFYSGTVGFFMLPSSWLFYVILGRIGFGAIQTLVLFLYRIHKKPKRYTVTLILFLLAIGYGHYLVLDKLIGMIVDAKIPEKVEDLVTTNAIFYDPQQDWFWSIIDLGLLTLVGLFMTIFWIPPTCIRRLKRTCGSGQTFSLLLPILASLGLAGYYIYLWIFQRGLLTGSVSFTDYLGIVLMLRVLVFSLTPFQATVFVTDGVREDIPDDKDGKKSIKKKSSISSQKQPSTKKNQIAPLENVIVESADDIHSQIQQPAPSLQRRSTGTTNAATMAAAGTIYNDTPYSNVASPQQQRSRATSNNSQKEDGQPRSRATSNPAGPGNPNFSPVISPASETRTLLPSSPVSPTVPKSSLSSPVSPNAASSIPKGTKKPAEKPSGLAAKKTNKAGNPPLLPKSQKPIPERDFDY